MTITVMYFWIQEINNIISWMDLKSMSLHSLRQSKSIKNLFIMHAEVSVIWWWLWNSQNYTKKPKKISAKHRNFHIRVTLCKTIKSWTRSKTDLLFQLIISNNRFKEKRLSISLTCVNTSNHRKIINSIDGTPSNWLRENRIMYHLRWCFWQLCSN